MHVGLSTGIRAFWSKQGFGWLGFVHHIQRKKKKNKERREKEKKMKMKQRRGKKSLEKLPVWVVVREKCEAIGNGGEVGVEGMKKKKRKKRNCCFFFFFHDIKCSGGANFLHTVRLNQGRSV